MVEIQGMSIIYGLDISFEQLKMNKCVNKSDIQGTMTNIPFRDNTFDSILSIRLSII